MSDDRRKAKLEVFLDRLNGGQDVQNRDLKTWLGPDAYADYDAAWSEQVALRKTVLEKPDAVAHYESLFKKARFLENKADGFSRGNMMKQAHKFRAESEKAYERLVEHYMEALEADPSLNEWFDRYVDLSPENAPSLIAECMPQVVTSRSAHRATGHHLTEQKKKKRAVKIEAVSAALAQCDVAFAKSYAASKQSPFVQRLLKAKAQR